MPKKNASQTCINIKHCIFLQFVGILRSITNLQYAWDNKDKNKYVWLENLTLLSILSHKGHYGNLRWLQKQKYVRIHRTNTLLKKRNLKRDKHCLYCHSSPETSYYLYGYWNIINDVEYDVRRWLMSNKPNLYFDLPALFKAVP